MFALQVNSGTTNRMAAAGDGTPHKRQSLDHAKFVEVSSGRKQSGYPARGDLRERGWHDLPDCEALRFSRRLAEAGWRPAARALQLD